MLPVSPTPVARLAGRHGAALALATPLRAAAVVTKDEEQEEEPVQGLAQAVGLVDGDQSTVDGNIFGDGGAGEMPDDVVGDGETTSEMMDEPVAGEHEVTDSVGSAAVAVAVSDGMASTSVEASFVPPAPQAG